MIKKAAAPKSDGWMVVHVQEATGKLTAKKLTIELNRLRGEGYALDWEKQGKGFYIFAKKQEPQTQDFSDHPLGRILTMLQPLQDGPAPSDPEVGIFMTQVLSKLGQQYSKEVFAKEGKRVIKELTTGMSVEKMRTLADKVRAEADIHVKTCDSKCMPYEISLSVANLLKEHAQANLQ
jgi:hypothetical protein